MENENRVWNDSVDSFYRQLLFRSQYAARKACVQRRHAPNGFCYDVALSLAFLILAVAACFALFSVASGRMGFHDRLSFVMAVLIEGLLVFGALCAFFLTNRACWYGELEWRNIYLPEGPRDPALEAAIHQVWNHTLDRRIRLVEFRHMYPVIGRTWNALPESRSRIREKEILFRALEFSFGGEKCWLEVDPPVRTKK